MQLTSVRSINNGQKFTAPPTRGNAGDVWKSNGDGTSSFAPVAYSSITGTPVLGSAAFVNTTTFLATSSNLNDVPDKAAGRSNLGLGNLAVLSNGSITGDISMTSGGATTLATVNSNAGTFTKFTVNAKGLITAATAIASSDITGALGYTPVNPATLGDLALLNHGSITGDISMTAGGAVTLSTVNGNVGSFSKVTVNAKGQVTGATNIGSSDVTTALGFTPVSTAVLGANNGVATLDGSGKLTTGQIPDALLGALVYQGVWNASTNSPNLSALTHTKGKYWKISVAGTTNLDGNAQWNVGDWAVDNGTTYDRLEGDSTEVTSVAGRVGAVVLTSSDVGLSSVTNDAQTKAAIVPNTAPTAGQVLIGNAGGTAYAKQTISGSGATISLSNAGVLTISAIANASLANSAVTIAGTSVSLGSSITQDTITGLSSTGLIKRTAANTLAIAVPGTDYGSGTVTSVATDSTLTGGPITSTGSLGINLSNANTWTSVQTIANNGIGTTSTVGLALSNSTAATNILDQYSPAMQFIGRYYSGGDRSTNWRVENRSKSLTWTHNDNGAGFSAPLMALNEGSVLTVSNVVCSNGVTTGVLNASSLVTFSGNGAASTPGLLITGTPYTAGSATTNFPQLYINNGATAPTTLSTSGTEFGINAPSGFAGNMIACHVNGAASVFSVSGGGAMTCSGQATVNSLQISSSGGFSFAARGSFTSPASGTIQMGSVDSGSISAQTFQPQSAVGSANVSASDWTFRHSLSTGSGTAGKCVRTSGFAGLTSNSATTINNSTPSAATFTQANHGFVPGQVVKFTTGGTLPSPLSTLTTYYVLASGLTANTFQVATTPGGTAIVTTTAGSGSHTTQCQTTTQNPATQIAAWGPSGLTAAQAVPVLDIQQYWNTSGTPSLIRANVIDIASNASALLIELQTNSADMFTVDKNGNMYIGGTISGYSAKINPQTGTTYTFTAADKGTVVEFNNASAITVTLPNNLPVGWNCRAVQTGAGQVTFSPASGATLKNRSSFTKTAAIEAEVDFYITTNAGGTSAVYRMAGDGA